MAPDSPDASGALHAGLNPTPVPTLVAAREELRDLHDRALRLDGAVVAGFNEVARQARTYADYVEALAATRPEHLDYVGLAILGPRSQVTRLTKRLALLS